MELAVLVLLIGLAAYLQLALYRRFAFRRLDYDCFFSAEERFEGEQLEFTEVVTNAKLLPLPWLKAEITTSKWLELSQLQSVVTDRTRFLSSFFVMKSFQRVTRTWKAACLKRGLFSVERVVLVSTDLLGGLLLSKLVPVKAHITVLPRALDLEAGFFCVNGSQGETPVRRQLLSDPFWRSGVRDYTGHEPMNRIHWTATAREGHLMVYQEDFTADRTRTVLLNMQTREYANEGSVHEERLENALRTCAALFEESLGEGIPVRFLANTPQMLETEVFAQPEQLRTLLRILAALELRSGEHFPFYLNRIYYQIFSSELALVTCYLDEATLTFAREKQAEGLYVRLYLLDPAAEALPEDLDIFQVRGRES